MESEFLLSDRSRRYSTGIEEVLSHEVLASVCHNMRVVLHGHRSNAEFTSQIREHEA